MKLGRFIGLGIFALSLDLPVATSVVADGGDTTLIHGCVAKDGTIRVVSASTACKNNETPTHWPTAARIVTDETRITNTENKNTTQDSQISAIQTKNTQQDAAIAALQGQGGGGAGGLVVKDSLGQVVGRVLLFENLSDAFVVSLVENAPISFRVNDSGFPNLTAQGSVQFEYTTNNCSGTRYMTSSSGMVEFTVQTTDGQTAYFPKWPLQNLAIQSSEGFGPGENPSGVGTCASFPSDQRRVGLASTMSLSSLTPPFHIE